MLGALKCFSSIGAVLMVLAGFAVVGITVFAFIDDAIFLNDSATRTGFEVALIVLCCVLIIIGVLGIVGVVRKICCLLAIYQVFVVLFLIAFIVIGVFGILLPENVFPNNCNDSSNYLVNQAYNVYKTA